LRLLSSLTNRIFLASAALAVLSMGVAIAVVNVRVTRAAEAELQRGLADAATLADEQRRVLFENLTTLARIVADLPKLKSAVDTHDPATVRPIASGYQGQVKSDLFLVTDRSGALLSDVGRFEVPADPRSVPAVRDALVGRETAMFWPQPEGILQVVTVPISIGLDQPEILGTLSVGFLLNQRLARQFKELTDSEIAFAVDGRIRASTLPADYQQRLEMLLQAPDSRAVSLGSDQYVALVRPMAPVGGPAGAGRGSLLQFGTFGGREAPVTLILRSRTERLRFLRAIHAALVVTAVVALALATLLSYAVARTVTRPLASITTTMREMATTGDLTRKVVLPAGNWEDEDARLLAATFNALTESVTRFQREAAQRERLSALGRLSTVVAHEIRNPLMIIKASLRTLGRESTSAQEIREAAADIDGEVERLKRVVNEVLDYARPIRFDLGESDLNLVCRDSAAASRTGDGATPVHLHLDPSLPPVVTDAERLRTVLVNVLTNAWHAVAARRALTPVGTAPGAATSVSAAPDVELSTLYREPDRIVIVVKDVGVGIEPQDLPHVFDPYFTTKRAGTGLGLPIAKNIVDGLGGTITVSSVPGTGTEVRIELPLQAKPRT
jgi:signal transduction histidine kinase